ncbi:YcgN family cysteine cluster protein [Sphingomonas profundi]|uniref:YcgN family cysteine cluster protein n=1 Tax=Alterirhizorhabdus profundi TaxID=2681549 RepID=UPI003BAF3A3A
MTETPQSRFWETTPLHRMTRAEWESLCDGCGKCCIHKLEDDETGELYPTNIACKLLDRRTGQCSDYRRRHAFVPECVRLTPAKLRQLEWLPTTCAYRLIDEGRPLPDWHHLVSGDREAVHRAGESVRGWTVSEEDVGDFENHIVDRIL